MKTGIIYIATNIVNEKSYIGQTIKKLESRKQKHYQCSKKYNYHFSNAIRKYGECNFKWKILYDNVPIGQLNNMERWCIANYDTFGINGYNETLGGDGVTMTPEIREKISKSNKGKISFPRTKEYRKKQSMAHNGKKYKPMSEEGRKNISTGKRGKIISEETREKMSLSLIGNTRAIGNSLYWEIIIPNGNIEIIKNLAKYCKDNNLDNGKMCKVSQGKRSHHKGYKVKKIGGTDGV